MNPFLIIFLFQFKDTAGIVFAKGDINANIHQEASGKLFAIEGAGTLANPNVTFRQGVGFVGIETC